MGLFDDVLSAINPRNLPTAPDLEPGAGAPVTLVTDQGEFDLDPGKPATPHSDTLESMVTDIRDLLRDYLRAGIGGGAVSAIPRRIALVANQATELVPARRDRSLPVLVRTLSGGPVLVNAGIQPSADDWPIDAGDTLEYHADEALYGVATVASVVVTWSEV